MELAKMELLAATGNGKLRLLFSEVMGNLRQGLSSSVLAQECASEQDFFDDSILTLP